jgi:hypothetical protein
VISLGCDGVAGLADNGDSSSDTLTASETPGAFDTATWSDESVARDTPGGNDTHVEFEQVGEIEGDDAGGRSDEAESDAEDAEDATEAHEDVFEPPLPEDWDEDGVPDEFDLFPRDRCEAWDLDGDGVGDGADPDRDGDSVPDRWERRVGTDPNDPLDFPSGVDSDGDGVPDYADLYPDDPDRSDDGIDPADHVQADLCVLNHYPGWFAGDLHAHTIYSDGKESIEEFVRSAEIYQDPCFLEVRPEYAGRPLQFMALTDHRTVDGAYDPAFKSDKVVLIPGNETGGIVHGNGLGLLANIPRESTQAATTVQRMAEYGERVHWQGGTYQANHPCSPWTGWTPDLEFLDAIEIWNTTWSIERRMTEAHLDKKVASTGGENIYIRPAIRRVGTSSNHQAMALWENALACGLHLPIVGGSDSHGDFPLGRPTTLVYARQLGMNDILDGIRAGRTAIARGLETVRAQAWLANEYGRYEVMIGGTVRARSGSLLQLRIRLERAAGHVVQVVAGPVLDSPCSRESLEEFEGGTVIEWYLVPEDAEEIYEWTSSVAIPSPGWAYLRVLEPLDLENVFRTSRLSEDLAPECASGEDSPIDDFLLSDREDQLLNLWQGSAPEDFYCSLGFVTSAFRVLPPL